MHLILLISTFYAILAYQKSIGFLGFTESLEVITAALISLISFNLINQNTKALKWIVISLIAMPALNMIAVLILTNQHVEFLGGNSGYTLVWYLGYGNRFIGLASNSNLIAIQAVVAISFIIAYFDSSENKSRKLIIDIKTIFLLIYIIGLIVMLLLLP